MPYFILLQHLRVKLYLPDSFINRQLIQRFLKHVNYLQSVN